MTEIGNKIPHSGFGVMPPVLQLVAVGQQVTHAALRANVTMGFALVRAGMRMNPFLQHLLTDK